MKIRRHNQNVYKMEKLNCYNKMKDKRGIKEISLRVLNSKPFYAFMIFLILGISMVIAGDVIFQQGNFNIDTNVLFVNSTSHGVGIGTSNPDTLLSIQSPSGASGIKNLSSIKNAVGNTRFFFQYDIDNVRWLITNRNETVILSIHEPSGGRVGIGTSSPTVGRLQVNQVSDTNTGGLAIVSSDTLYNLRLYHDGTRAIINSQSTGTGSLVLNEGGGNVGVGTASPTSTLTVIGNFSASGNSSLSNILFTNGSSVSIGTSNSNFTFEVFLPTNTATDSVYFTDDYGANIILNRRNRPTTGGQRLGYIEAQASNGVVSSIEGARIEFLTGDAWTSTSNPAYIDLRTTSNGSTSDTSRLLISPEGNITMDVTTFVLDAQNNRIGIGTKTPKQPLHVSGDANVTGTIYYGALVANSPHMFGADEQGYTRICVYDKLGFWNMVYWEDGIQKVDKNNKECKDKETRLEQVKIARENCETQNKVFNENDQSCSQKVTE